MKVIASYTKPEEAYLVASLLEGNGITTYVRDANTVNANWMVSNAIGGVKLEVDECDVAKAREVLNLPCEADGLLSCPFCSSQSVKIRELNLFTAICICFGFVLPVSSKRVDCLKCKRAFSLRSALLKNAEQPASANADKPQTLGKNQ